jgi:alpha-glucosidase (family GH31 glycosyl hydrolase)
VRGWLKLLYPLIPYLLDQSEKAVCQRLPPEAVPIQHHSDDPSADIDDEFYCGESLFGRSALSAAGRRRVNLPADNGSISERRDP